MIIKKWNGSAWVAEYPEVDVDSIVATGTPSSSTFLRGDGAWAVPTAADGNNYLTGVSGSGDGTVTFTRSGLSNLTWDASHSHSEYAPLASPSFTGNVSMAGGLEISGDLEVVGNSIGFVDTNFDAKIEVSDANPNGTGAVFDFYGDGVSRNATLSAEQFDGNAATTTKWLTARTITLGGDLSGSVSLDGSANVTLSAQVANNSHQHSQLYENSTITYGASYLQWTDQSGNGGAGTNGAAPGNPTNEWWHHLIMNHANNGGYYFDLASAFHSDSMYFRRNVNGSLTSWRQIFHDTYHPNADKWTTARTITLGGDLVGNVSLDGSANVTLSAAVANDSHTHDGRYYTETETNNLLAAKAPLASPVLTGIPTAPTAAANTNTTQIATTAYVQGEITDLIGGAPGALDTLNELAAAINDDASYASTITTALAAKAPLASPSFTGNVSVSGTITANGLTVSNDNIVGVNQLEINDPGEGIVFKQGSSGDMTLAITDDSFDSILNFSGTNAALAVNGTTVSLSGHNHDSRYYTESEVDTLLAGKASSSHNHSATEIVTGEMNTARLGSGTATSGYVLKSDGDGTASWQQDNNTTYSLGSFGVTATASELNKMDGVTATTTELNYTDGVTSNIQTQLNSKLSTSAAAAAVSYVTSCPTSTNSTGMKVYVGSTDCSTKYSGWLYIVT